MNIGPIWRAMLRHKAGFVLIALQIAVTLTIMVNAFGIIQIGKTDDACTGGLDLERVHAKKPRQQRVVARDDVLHLMDESFVTLDRKGRHQDALDMNDALGGNDKVIVMPVFPHPKDPQTHTYHNGQGNAD